MTLADVNLWGRRIGAVRQDTPDSFAVFEYDPPFLASGFEPSPLRMPTRAGLFEFPGLPRATFHGLPGMLWDSLPDHFGRRLIERYFESAGRPASSLDSVQLLCYVGTRGMGALEFTPSLDRPTISAPIDVSRLREFAALAFEDDASWSAELSSGDGIEELLEVGTSAGGARPKAVIGWNPETNEVRSGRVDLAAGFEYWILKFDGVGNGSREFGRSRGYGAIEYAYSRMAAVAGVEMSECRIFSEGGRRHFMTRRFDRRSDGSKLHMQTHAGLTHVDFNQVGSASYEDVFDVLREIDAPAADIEQQYVRMLFNVVARNQDDHPKNISYLMNKQGEWRLSPAYDLSFAFNPTGEFTSRHQMSINGKLDGFTTDDFRAIAERAGLVRGRWTSLLDKVIASTEHWQSIAADAEVPSERASAISDAFRLKF